MAGAPAASVSQHAWGRAVPSTAQKHFSPPKTGGGVPTELQRQSHVGMRAVVQTGGGGHKNVWQKENSFDSDDSDALAYHDDPNDRDYK